MKEKHGRLTLDRIDLKILATLQDEGRITKLKLAEKAGLSPTPCWERLQRLEKAGVITGYHARVALPRVARVATIWTEMTLKSHGRADFDRFEAAVREIPEIVECWATGGGIDYLVRFVVRDVDTYQRLVDGMLTAEIGIDRYFTYIVTRPVKDATQLPIDQLLDEG
jgi:Lrp/AsnC family transcriptional regulator, regulator of ectoine-degradation genes